MKKCASCGREFHTEKDYLTHSKRWRVCSMQNLWFNCECGSTLMIPKGKYDWYTPDKTLSSEAASIFNQLSTKQMPYIPSAVMQIQQLLEDENSSPMKLAQEVKREPIIAAEVLRIANNLKAGTGTSINSVQHAITFIGRKTVKDIVVTAVVKTFKFRTKKFSQEAFWQEAFLTASICEELIPLFGKDLIADEVYLAGCLANLGKIVGAICIPQKIDKVHEMIHNPKTLCTWDAAEKQLESFDHRILGEIACSLWGFPDYIREAATNHHEDLSHVDPQSPYTISELVTFANQLHHWIRLQPHRIDDQIMQGIMKRFQIDDGRIEVIANDIKRKLEIAA